MTQAPRLAGLQQKGSRPGKAEKGLCVLSAATDKALLGVRRLRKELNRLWRARQAIGKLSV